MIVFLERLIMVGIAIFILCFIAAVVSVGLSISKWGKPRGPS